VKVLFIQKMAGIAGSETYFMNLLPELARQGVSVEFACIEHPDDAHKNDVFRKILTEGGVLCHSYQSSNAIPLGALWQLRKLIATVNYDLVQTNLIHADFWGALLKITRLGRLKLISGKHGYSGNYQAAHGFDPTHLKHDLFSFITRISGYFANKVFCISNGLRNFLVEGNLIDKRKIVTIPYGLDFDEVPRWLNPGEGRFGSPQIIVVARLVPVKQHELLLDCLPELAESFPDLKVIMIGDGILKDKLTAQAAQLGVAAHVEWLGFQRNVHDYIRDSDILVLPSATEGFGLVVLEAWSNRTPVVAFNVPALNEIIEDKRNGLLVPPFDKTALADSLKYLFNDPEKIISMGKTGYTTFRTHYSMEIMVKKTLSLYRSVIDAQRVNN